METLTMSLTSDLLRNLATDVQRSATARIGSAQRRNHAEEAKVRAAKLGMTSFAKEATSAALLACMVALAWNENKRANAKRLRAANRRMADLLEFHASSGVLPQSDVDLTDYDSECARTFQAANALRTQAIDAAKYLRYLAQMIEFGS